MGGPAALALVMAGVGKVIIAHGGRLHSPDLNRQVLGCESILGEPRAEPFAAYLRGMNRFVTVEAIDHEPDDEEALALARRVNIVLLVRPTFEERLRLNRAAVRAGVPLVDAAQWGMTGTLLAVDPGRTACLQCIYPVTPRVRRAVSRGRGHFRGDGLAGGPRGHEDPFRRRLSRLRPLVGD